MFVTNKLLQPHIIAQVILIDFLQQYNLPISENINNLK